MKRFYFTILLVLLVALAAPGETAHNLLLQNNRVHATYDLTVIPEILRSDANVFFVDNESGNAVDAGDGRHGESPTYPFKTYDYAVGKCTAGENNVIVIMPYSIEDYDGAGDADVDISGITTIGLGYGPARPKFLFTGTAGTFVVGRTGDGATFKNITFQSSITAVTLAVQIEDGADNISFIDCEWLDGEASVDEFVTAVDVVTEANDVSFERCAWTSAAAAGATACIDIGDGVVTGLRVVDCVMYGDYATACVFSDQSNIDCLFDNTVFVNLNADEFGIEFQGTGSRGVVRNCSFATSGNYVDMGGMQDGGGCKTSEYAADSDTISYGSFSLSAGGITSASMATDSIGADEVADDAIDAGAIADDAIDATAVATDTIDADAVADDAIDAGAIADGAIDAATLATDTITAAKIAADAITASEIAASAIGADEIAANAIGSSEIATGAIDADAIASDAITAAKIAADAITASELATDAITSAEIASGAIAADEIATDAIGAAELAADAVAEIADGVADEAVAGHVTAATIGAMLQPLHSGTASAGAAGTITLQNSASALADFYNGSVIQIIGGTGAGQSRIITDYAVTTFITNVAPNWITTPGSDSVYVVYGGGTVRVDAFTGDTITAAAIADDAIDAGAIADAAIDAATFAATGLGAIQSEVGDAIDANNLDHLAGLTTGVAADSDLETYAVSGSLLAHITSIGADITTFKPTTDSLEAIGTAVAAVLVDTAAMDDVAGMVALVDPNYISYDAPRILIETTSAMTNANGYAAADDPAIFTVTGSILARVFAIVGTAVTSTSADTLELGVAGDTACLLVQADADGVAFAQNDCWTLDQEPDTPSAVLTTDWVVIPNSLDIALTINDHDLTAGVVTFYLMWIPLSPDAAVVGAAP